MDNLNQSAAISFAEISGYPEADSVWDTLVCSSPDAWCWHTRRWKDYVLAAAKNRNPSDRSFFIFQNGKLVGFCPVVITDTRLNGTPIRHADYQGEGLPWPCVSSSVADRPNVLEQAIEHAELLARTEGADIIRFSVSSPYSSREASHFEPIAIKRNYVEVSYLSHLMTLTPDTPSSVRERYRRYVKKFSKLIRTEIVSDAAISEEIIEIYYNLHVKDAGGVVRDPTSYHKIGDAGRAGEGFFVIARLESNQPVGALFVSLLKNAAFDSSVGVDPDYQDQFVSHLMKWKAIEYLLAEGVEYYDLGMFSGTANWGRIPSKKQRGISLFKDGWTRGGFRLISAMEKFLTPRALDLALEAKKRELAAMMAESVNE